MIRFSGVFLFSFFISLEAFSEPSPIVQWIEDLAHSNPLIQSEAQFQLEQEGKKAVPFLMESLRSPQVRDRSRILYLLAKQGKKEILPFLREEFNKKGHDIQRLIFSFGWVGEAQDVPRMFEFYPMHGSYWIFFYHFARRNFEVFLEGLYLKDPFFQFDSTLIEAIQALPLSSAQWAALFKKPKVATQAGVLFILRHRRGKEAAPFFKAGLQSSEPSILYQAIVGTGECGIRSFFPELLEIIPKVLSQAREQTREAELLQKALEGAILKLGGTRSHVKLLWKRASLAPPHEKILDIKLLLKMNSSVLSLEDQKYFKEDMSVLQDQAGAFLEDLLKRHEKDFVKKDSILKQLAEIRIKRFSKVLMAHLNDSHASDATKGEILDYVGEVAPRDGEAALAPFLHEAELEERAIRNLRRFKSQAAVHFLIEHLQRTASPYEDRMIEALNEIRPPHFEDIIFPFLSSPYAPTRLKVLEGLSTLKPSSYWEDVLIWSAMYAREDDVLLFVIQELVKIKSKKSVPHLRLIALTTRQPEIKQKAQWALSQLSKN